MNTPRLHPADVDTARLQTLVYELVTRFQHPDTHTALPGLLALAWTPPLGLLASRQPSEGGSSGRPGSRPPLRLDLLAHAESCLDQARELADDLGFYTNGADGLLALRRLPVLLEPTFVDCRSCDRCLLGHGNCGCRHRIVTHTIAVSHSTLRTALNFQPARIDWRGATCPECGRVGKLSVRGEAVWCRHSDCSYARTGTFSILAAAS
jgi:hypothetical protein